MAQVVNLPNNLPPASNPWGRQVSDGLNNLENAVDRFIANQANSNRATASNTQTLSSQTGILQQQTATLQEQQNYLASLVTVGAEGVTADNPAVPGDSVFRYYSSDPSLSLTVQCPTGRLLLQYGSGECRVDPRDGIISASVTFHLESPSGWVYDPATARARVTAYTPGLIAVPLAASTTVSGIPTNEPISVSVRYGIWSNVSGGARAGDAHHTSNYLVAQVIP